MVLLGGVFGGVPLTRLALRAIHPLPKRERNGCPLSFFSLSGRRWREAPDEGGYHPRTAKEDHP